MHSQKLGVRPDTRNRPHRSPQPDNRAHRSHQEQNEASKVSPLQVAARVANLKILLEKSGGDIPGFAGVAEVSLEDLRQILDGQKVVGDERATHIEMTLELGQGWLDKKHDISDITPTTVDILLGKDVSTFEKEIRNSEQIGQEIMKNTATATAAAAAPKSAPATNASSDKASPEMVEVRIENLKMLTNARGAKSKLSRLMGISESLVSFLFSRSKEFTNSFTRQLESGVSLPEGWMDTPRNVSEVPQETWDKLGSSASLTTDASAKKASAKASKAASKPPAQTPEATPAGSAAAPAPAPAPAEVPRGQRVHRLPRKGVEATSQPAATKPAAASKPAAAPSQGMLTLNLRSTSAPAPVSGAKGNTEQLPEMEPQPASSQMAQPLPDTADTAAPASASAPATREKAKTSTSSKPAAPATNSGTLETAAPAAAAPAPAPAPAPASAPEPAPAPVAAAAPQETSAISHQVSPSAANVTPAAGGAVRPYNENADVLELSSLFLSPITEALLKTLAIKAKQGLFSEKDAYRLLGEIAEL